MKVCDGIVEDKRKGKERGRNASETAVYQLAAQGTALACKDFSRSRIRGVDEWQGSNGSP